MKTTSMHIALIGGNGSMGILFAKLFKSGGHTVYIGSRSVPGSYQHAIQKAEIVILSVPIHAVAETVEQIRPLLSSKHLLVDFSSVQVLPGRALRKLGCACVSMHPLFGPHVSDIRGQVFACSLQNKIKHKGIKILESFFRSLGAEVLHTTPENHDMFMSLTQALIHAVHITSTKVTADAIQKKGLAKDYKKISTPVSRLHRAVTGRIFSQSPELYANILMQNPEVLRILDAEITELKNLKKCIQKKDFQKFQNIYLAGKSAIGDQAIKTAVTDTNNMLKVIK